MPPSPVVVAKVRKSQQSATLTVVGTVTPIRDSVIGSAVDGRVIEVFVEEGDSVKLVENEQFAASPDSNTAKNADTDIEKIGQPLLQLRTGTLQIQIDTAQVELMSREQVLIQAKEAIPNEIEQLEATVAEIHARLDFAESDFERVDKLHRQGGLAKKERDATYSLYQTESQQLIVATAILRRQSKTRDARLKQAEAQVDLQLEELRRLEDLKKKYTIRAPFDGAVVMRMAEVGQWISAGDDVMQVVQLDPIEVTVKVPQSKIHALQSKLDESVSDGTPMIAQVHVDSISELLEGNLRRIVPMADLRSRSFPVKIRLNNPKTKSGYLLKPGMLARVSVATGDSANVLLVKKDALVLGGDQIQVFVVSLDPITKATVVRSETVEIGASIDDWIEVRGLLNEGDEVVVEGNERLRPGQPVRILGGGN